MRSSFIGLFAGLAFAIALVYLLIVVNFQSWLDALIIITALPGALAGICWCLFLTPDHVERSCFDGSHHEHRRRDIEQRSGHHLCQRTAGRNAKMRSKPHWKQARLGCGPSS